MARRRLTPAQPGYLGGRMPGTGAGGASATPSVAPPIAPPIAKVSGQSAEAAALSELTEGIETARREGRMVVEVPLADVSASFLLRDRVRLDREDLDALKASIRDRGQRTPAEIMPLDGAPTGNGPDDGTDDGQGAGASGVTAYRFALISGWRRLRALSELYEETGDLRFSTLRALICSDTAAAGAYVAMVEENEIRVGLSYYERARLVAEATRRGVFPDHAAATRSLFATASPAKRSKITSFIDIHTDLGDLLTFPAEIPERLGLALVARLRRGGREDIRAALRAARPASATAEVKLLGGLVRRLRPEPPKTAQAGEAIGTGLRLSADRKGDRIAVTLSGPAVDDALLARVRALMRGLG